MDRELEANKKAKDEPHNEQLLETIATVPATPPLAEPPPQHEKPPCLRLQVQLQIQNSRRVEIHQPFFVTSEEEGTHQGEVHGVIFGQHRPR
jgi:hypothetical protein